MKLVPFNIDDITGSKFYSKSDNLKLLENFIDSGLECAEVKNFNQSSASGCCAALKNSARRYGMTNIGVMNRRGRVFLVRK